MHSIPDEVLKKANEEAIYCLYVYLAHKTTPAEGETLQSIAQGLDAAFRNPASSPWEARDVRRLHILRNAIANQAASADAKIGNLIRSRNGLTACTFTKPNGAVSVVFRGTGRGEWIDNGEGLSGIPEKNIYITYRKNGKPLYRKIVRKDYATDQQVEALNWFRSIAAKSEWDSRTAITVSGHSKGGNKAQFVAIHSDLVRSCYSFDGQGFSPEALAAFQKKHRGNYEKRRRNIKSFSAENDYVNVLGRRLVPESQVYYFRSANGLHPLEAMLDKNGRFYPQCEQGALSRYVETVSEDLMAMDPAIRQLAALGVMNVFQKFLGEGRTVNGDTVSAEETAAGLAITLAPLLRHLGSIKDISV